jgi:hypothetical protein
MSRIRNTLVAGARFGGTQPQQSALGEAQRELQREDETRTRENRHSGAVVFPISEHLFENIGTQFPPPSAILYGKVSSITEFLIKIY